MEFKKLREYKRSQFESKDFGDCSIFIKLHDGLFPKKLRAIKTVLQIASPVFDSLLRESKEPEIVIENCNPTVFQKFLNFIQWEEIDIEEVVDAFALINLSRKYEIMDLEKSCETFLDKSCIASNACTILEKSKELDMQGLFAMALSVIKAETKEVFASSSLLDAKIDTLVTILEQDALNIDSEMEAFEMVSRYAEHNGLTVDSVGLLNENEKEKSATLTDLMKQIRFKAMKPKKFASKPLLSNLLTAEQKNAIIGKLLLPFSSSQAFPEGFSLKKGRINYKK